MSSGPAKTEGSGREPGPGRVGAEAEAPSAAPALLIQPLSAADRKDWAPLWQGYQAFYRTRMSDEVVETTWARLLDPAEPVHGALARAGTGGGGAGAALGLVHWVFHRSTWTSGDYCYLQDLFVADAARGQGLGRALIAHVSAAATRAGCARLYWLTHETNTAAMALYDRVAERSGFLQYRQQLA